MKDKKLEAANHESFMREALKEAEKALEKGEVPVGAVIVREGKIIARAHNQKEQLQDATAHAEMIVLTQASEALANWRLLNATLYVTLEPCAMCAGALLQARISKLVFGAHDPQQGACGSRLNIIDNQIPVEEGILADECKQLLVNFFKNQRAKVDE